MFPQVFQQLKSSTAVKAIVGTNPPRIYRKRAPPDLPKTSPYIVWFLVAGTPENNLSEPPPVDRDTVQVDNWHPDDKGCELLADASRASLESIGTVTSILIDERDAETNLYRIAFQIDIFNGRS